MIRHLSSLLSKLKIPPLPMTVWLQRHDLTVDVSGEIWKVEQRILDWRDVAMMHPLLLHIMKLYFCKFMEVRTADTAHKNFRRMVQTCGGAIEFDNWEGASSEDLAVALEDSIEAALNRLSPDTVKQIRTMFVKFYDFIEEYDLPFYRNEFHARLCEMYFQKPIPHKGVMTLDPNRGPLSRVDEYYLLASLELDDGDMRDVAVISLLHAWGLRPRQVWALNRSDLMVSSAGDYTLRVVRVKQHEGALGEEYKLRKLTTRLGGLIGRYLTSVKSIVNIPMSADFPMFLDPRADGEDLRLSTKAISQIPMHYADKRKLISPVTREPMILNPRRLRETFGTRCAEMPGMTKELLAEMLDHSSTRSLEVYFDFRESIAKEMGKLIASRKGTGTLRDLTESFMGRGGGKGAPSRTEFPVRFISKLDEATCPDKAAARLMPPELCGDLDEIPFLGLCGGSFRCGIAPIITCYSCSEFEPWIGADHDMIVAWVRKLLQRAAAKGQKDDAEEFELLLTKAEYVARRARQLQTV